MQKQRSDGKISHEERREELRQKILSGIDLTREMSDGEILDLIDEEIVAAAQRQFICPDERGTLRREIFNSIRKLDILEELLGDDSVTEIMINGSRSIFVERNGEIMPWNGRFISDEKLEDVVQQIVSSCNRVVNVSRPIADARLSGGARVNIVLPPIAPEGPVVTIRRFPDKRILMDDLLEKESISEEIAGFFRDVTAAGYNVFVSGGTGSGKTTFLNVLSDFIPSGERVITIEDNAELQIRHIPNLVRLEARNANVEGNAAVTIRDLIRTSLRMRPDRIIVGEVRGGEVVDMISAMNTGHDGSMSTGHGNSAPDMLSRLDTMMLMSDLGIPLEAARGQIASGIDILVHLGRLRDGSRKLLSVDELTGIRNGQYELSGLYRFCETGEKSGRVIGKWEHIGDLADVSKLRRAGLYREKDIRSGTMEIDAGQTGTRQTGAAALNAEE